MAENKKFAYIRVSSKDQNLDRQIQAMLDYGISERDIYADKQSGKDTNRPQYQALKQVLRQGDTVVIKSIDRLGRNYTDIKNEWKDIVENIGADIEVIDMPELNTNRKNEKDSLMSKVISDIVLTLLGYVAEQERAFIRQRQAEGIAKNKDKFAKANKIQAPEGFKELFEKAAKGEMKHTKAMEELHLSKTTYYRIAKELGLKTNKKIVGKKESEV